MKKPTSDTAVSPAEAAAGSLLVQIKERELELSGRVLAARQEADEIITEGRRRAQEIAAAIEAETGEQAASVTESIMDAAHAEVEALDAESAVAISELRDSLSARHEEAVAYVVGLVTEVRVSQ